MRVLPLEDDRNDAALVGAELERAGMASIDAGMNFLQNPFTSDALLGRVRDLLS